MLENAMLWRQFAVAIDQLGAALRACPEELWERPLWPDDPDQWVAAGFSRFWYQGYHALFWLDLYLTGAEEGFAPPPPFALVEMEAHETLPRVYTRAELLAYLADCRAKCQAALTTLTTEQAYKRCSFSWGEVSFVELQLYSLRHVQEHAGQLGMFIGQHAGQFSPPASPSA